jgi:opacity protein-like surface antigen
VWELTITTSAEALTIGDTKAMKKLLLIALTTSMAMGANAADDKKFYAGGAGSFWRINSEITNEAADDTDFNLSALEGSFGYEALPWLALEGRVGVGIERDRADTGFTQFVAVEGSTNLAALGQIAVVTTELNYYASFYLKPQIKNDIAIFYGLLGYTTFDVDLSADQVVNFSQEFRVTPATATTAQILTPVGDPVITDGAPAIDYSESEGSLSLGVGVGFYFYDNYVFNIEYKNFVQSSPGTTSTSLRANGVTFGVNYSF